MIRDCGSHYEIVQEFPDTFDDFSKKLDKPLCWVNPKNGSRIYYTNGERWNPVGPTELVNTRTEYQEHWYMKDASGNLERGRRDGPAMIVHKFGLEYSEQWHNHDKEQKPSADPDSIHIRYVTEPSDEMFETLEHYKQHFSSLDGASYEVVHGRMWYPSDPSELTYDVTDRHVIDMMKLDPAVGTQQLRIMKTKRMEFSRRENIKAWVSPFHAHRTDGPAVVTLFDVKEHTKNGRALPMVYKRYEVEWFLHGKPIPIIEIKNFCRRANIILSEGPCHDRSVFLKEQDHMIFLSDFVSRYAPN